VNLLGPCSTEQQTRCACSHPTMCASPLGIPWSAALMGPNNQSSKVRISFQILDVLVFTPCEQPHNNGHSRDTAPFVPGSD
jgi:hypothetical protein